MKNQNRDEMWVYIESGNQAVEPVSLELCCEVRRLCDEAGKKLTAICVGKVQEADIGLIEDCGVDKIMQVSCDAKDFTVETLSGIFVRLCKKYAPDAVFVGATSSGRDFAPHFAAALGTGCTSDATELIYNKENGNIEFIEPAAGGKIMAVITIPELRPQVGTIRPGTFEYKPTGRRSPERTESQISIPQEEILSEILSVSKCLESTNVLSSADKVICIGNGLRDAKQLAQYRELAEILGATLGCTRPVVDRNLMSYDRQIGQSGTAVRPKLYLCFGVSGAVNHVTGVHADCFVAVNSDPDAMIFNYCDYGIVGDMDAVCEEMIELLKNGGKKS